MKRNNLPVEKTIQNYLDIDYLKVDLKNRTIRGGVFTFIAQGIVFLLNMLSTIILARILTPEDFGVIAMVSAIIGFIGLFKDMGLSMATVQKSDVNYIQINSLFWVNVILSLILTLIIILISPLIAWFYSEPRLIYVTVALAMGFTLSGLAVQHQALLRRQMLFGCLAFINVISILAGILIAIVLALSGMRYWALVFMNVGSALVSTLGIWIACKWRPNKNIDFRSVREMIGFGGNITAFNIINYAGAQLDRILLGKYYGADCVGLYNKAYSLLLFPLMQLNNPIGAVSIPALSRLVDEPTRYRNAYLKILRHIIILAIPCIAFLIPTADWIIRIVLGPQWDEAAKIFAILGFAGLAMPILNTIGWLFITQGRTRDMFYWGLIDGAIKILSVFVGLKWGITGVAAAVSIRSYLFSPLCLWFCCRKGPVKMRDFLPLYCYAAFLAASVFTVVLVIRKNFEISSPIIGVTVCFLSTVIIVLAILCIFPQDRSTLKNVLSFIVKKVQRIFKCQD